MSDTRARIEAILAHWLRPLPPGVHDELVEDLEEIIGVLAEELARRDRDTLEGPAPSPLPASRR